MAVSAAAAIRKADPKATIVGPACAMFDWPFLETFLQSGVLQNIDAVSMHPYRSFKLGPGAATAWQHDAREQPDGAITFFDNGASPQVHPASRAVEVALNPTLGTATLVRSYTHPAPLVADSDVVIDLHGGGTWCVNAFVKRFEGSEQLAADLGAPFISNAPNNSFHDAGFRVVCVIGKTP